MLPTTQLKDLKRCVVWRYTWSPDKKKWDKPPLQTRTRRAASSTDPRTWTTFAEALDAYQKGDIDGIGFVLIEDNGFVGIDLDHCRDPNTGEIEPWALDIVKNLNTYTEVSPSAEGLRLWARGHLPPGGRKKGPIEMYTSGRYLTMTGCHLHDTPHTIEPRQAAIDALHARVFAKTPSSEAPSAGHSSTNGTSPTLDDDILLHKALGAKNAAKFAALWAGNISAYSSHSEAGLALCAQLSFWTSEDARRIHAMLDLARSEPGIPLNYQDLDRDRWLLNVSNSTMNSRTGTLQPHCRDDLLTKMTLVRYDPRAACPRWCQFLYEIMDKNQDLIDYLQRAVGYSLTGSVQEQVLFFLYGLGVNGKSTFLSTILALLGEYAMQAMPELWLVRTGEHHPTERADLFGKRFVATVEVEAGKQLAEALTKLLTGGERIRARRMREDAWEFAPSHKLWLAANYKPIIKGTDYAMWRRIKLIPFTTTIADDRKDPKLLEKLIAELPGILRWAIEGCLAWQQGGLQEPKEVTDAVQAYQLEMDIVGQFLDDHCWLKPDHPEVRTQSSALYQAFCHYAGDAMTQTAFSERLTARGYTKRKTDGRYWWIGIGLNAPEDVRPIRAGDF